MGMGMGMGGYRYGYGYGYGYGGLWGMGYGVWGDRRWRLQGEMGVVEETTEEAPMAHALIQCG